MTPPREQGWQDIATAPKNPSGEMSGPFILVFCGYDGVVRQARWTVVGPLPGMAWAGFDGISIYDKKPTHWMPLPAPPESGK